MTMRLAFAMLADGSFMLAQAVTLTQVPLPVAGLYQARVICGGAELGAVQLSVVLTPDV